MRCDLLRKICRFQFYALLFGLPFEYYFAGREHSFFTSLKLQVLLLVATWALAKMAETSGSTRLILRQLRESLPILLLLAVAAFVGSQLLAAAFAPEFHANAFRAAAKGVCGALLALLAADLAADAQQGSSTARSMTLGPLLALSISGTLVALLGVGELTSSAFLSRTVDIFRSSSYHIANHTRLASTMEYPNTAGSFLSVSFCASLALMIFAGAARSRTWSSILMGFALLQAGALVLTFSRGALGATIIAVLAAAWGAGSFIRLVRARIAVMASLAVLLGGVMVSCLAHRQGVDTEKRSASYKLGAEEDLRYLVPAHTYAEVVGVRNNSHQPWARWEYGVGYRWYNLSSRQNSPLQTGAIFPQDIKPARQVEVQASLTTPSQPGEYLLIWFIFRGSANVSEVKDSYSPAVLCIVGAAVDARQGLSSTAVRYARAIRQERRDLGSAYNPGRLQLWSAALRMFARHPVLGSGPDSFRLLKRKYMTPPQGDETILANSLYLETLSDSGIVGLICLLYLIWEFGRHIYKRIPSPDAFQPRQADDPTSGTRPMIATRMPIQRIINCFGYAYLAGFLAHGLVDYFLKFTPTFLLFWLVLGWVCAIGRKGVECR